MLTFGEHFLFLRVLTCPRPRAFFAAQKTVKTLLGSWLRLARIRGKHGVPELVEGPLYKKIGWEWKLLKRLTIKKLVNFR